MEGTGKCGAIPPIFELNLVLCLSYPVRQPGKRTKTHMAKRADLVQTYLGSKVIPSLRYTFSPYAHIQSIFKQFEQNICFFFMLISYSHILTQLQLRTDFVDH